jgi:predicted RNA-binding protein YlxR (DUF448 family)
VTGLPFVTASQSMPMRTCVGCRTRDEQRRLLRVVTVQGSIVPDPRRRLPGRGAYLHHKPECLALAERKRAFSRAFRLPGPFAVDEVRALLVGEAAAAAGTGTARGGSGSTPHAGDEGRAVPAGQGSLRRGERVEKNDEHAMSTQ